MRVLTAFVLLVPSTLAGCAAGVQRFDTIMMDKVRRKAAYDFQCDAAALEVTKIDNGSYGASGCGKRATYVGKDGNICWSGNYESNLEQYCQVVPDTFAQEQQTK